MAGLSNKAEQAGMLSLMYVKACSWETVLTQGPSLDSSQNVTAPNEDRNYSLKEEIEMCAHDTSPPISEADFKHILKAFHLPLATPSMYCEETPHSQQYLIEPEELGMTGLGTAPFDKHVKSG